MVEQDLTLHTGSDFSFSYVVPQDSDLNLGSYKAACKIRKRPYGEVILELQPVIESKQVIFLISGQESANKHISGGDYLYDAFIYNDEKWLKLGQGTMTIIPDISMHN